MRFFYRSLGAILCVLVVSLSSCHSKTSSSSEVSEPTLCYRMASYVTDDGWVYVFDNQFFEDDVDYGSQVIDRWPFAFNAYNLRYRYNDDYTVLLGDETVLDIISVLGDSDSQVERKDMDKIATYLGYERTGNHMTTSELLALTPEDLDFEYLDPEIFLGLMQECLTSEPDSFGPYENLPSSGLFTEPAYINGYKFQVGMRVGFANLEVFVFDVLYRTGDGLTDYVQLYDLVRDGEASEEQIRLLQILQELETGMTQNNDHQYMIDTYGNAVVAGVDLSRLYLMVENIVNLEYSEYIILPQ